MLRYFQQIAGCEKIQMCWTGSRRDPLGLLWMMVVCLCETVQEHCLSFQWHGHQHITTTLQVCHPQGLPQNTDQTNKYDTDEKRHTFSLHQTVSQLGAPLTTTILNIHIFTKIKCINNMGNKHTYMASEPVQYMIDFESRMHCYNKMQQWQISTWFISGHGSGQ